MFNPENFVKEKIGWIREEVGDRIAVAAVSGGVDSTTTAVLGFRALGEKLKIIFLDDGLMREGESETVVNVFRKMGMDVAIFNVQEKFFEALKGKIDPEEKRKIFRETFYQVLAEIAKSFGAECLLQGTIAADIVETVKRVKTQHNVLEQVGINPMEKYGFKVIEPLKELYKHQVREVAKILGLPEEICNKRPFPGPGLAIRVLGEVTPEKIEIVRKATKIVEEETKKISCFQSFAVLLNDKATGVSENGERIYGNIIALRVVRSKDALTAKINKIPYKTLEKIVKRILKEVPNVVRVVYDLTNKPPATIEWE